MASYQEHEPVNLKLVFEPLFEPLSSVNAALLDFATVFGEMMMEVAKSLAIPPELLTGHKTEEHKYSDQNSCVAQTVTSGYS